MGTESHGSFLWVIVDPLFEIPASIKAFHENLDWKKMAELPRVTSLRSQKVKFGFFYFVLRLIKDRLKIRTLEITLIQ